MLNSFLDFFLIMKKEINLVFDSKVAYNYNYIVLKNKAVE